MALRDAPTSLREYQTLQELVFRDLRARILAGEIKPGQRLRATAIGEELGVSPTPAREAIRRLQEQGLVTVRQRRGAVVTEFSVADVAERYLVRMALEPLAAREGVAHLTPDDFEALERHLAAMERALREDERGRFLDHDQAFRTILFRASGLEFLCQLISTVWDGVAHHQQTVTALSGQAERYLANYRRLLAAARVGDATMVETVIREDLDASRQELIRFLEDRQRAAAH